MFTHYHFLTVCLPACLAACLSFCMSFSRSIDWFVGRLFAWLLDCRCVCLAICFFLCPFVCFCAYYYVFVSLFLCLSLCELAGSSAFRSVRLSADPSFLFVCWRRLALVFLLFVALKLFVFLDATFVLNAVLLYESPRRKPGWRFTAGRTSASVIRGFRASIRLTIYCAL